LGMLTKESSLYEIFIRHAEDTRKLVLILKDEVKNQTAYTQQGYDKQRMGTKNDSSTCAMGTRSMG
jgi:hypothetical protein